MAFNVNPQEFHNNAVSLFACASCSWLVFSNVCVAVVLASPSTSARWRSFNPAKSISNKQWASECVILCVILSVDTLACLACRYLWCSLSIGGTVAHVAETCPGHVRLIQWRWTNLGLWWVGSGHGRCVTSKETKTETETKACLVSSPVAVLVHQDKPSSLSP